MSSTIEDDATLGFRPLYAQVRDLFVRRLASGEWRAGELLPAEPRLAAELGVSLGTVRKALDELSAQNRVVRRQGKGTYVASYTPERALFQFFQLIGEDGSRVLPESRVLSCRIGIASAVERRELRLAARAPVVRIARVRELAGRAVIAERIALSAARFPGLAELPREQIPNTLYVLYERGYGISVAQADERLRAVAAGPSEQRLLSVPSGAPLLEVDRLALDHAGDVVEWRLSRCNTRHCHYGNTLK